MNGKLADQLNLISRIAIGKLLNMATVFASYHFSKITKTPAHRGMPFSLSVEPTTSCNLRCPECPSGLRSFTRPTGMMTLDTFKAVIEKVQDSLVYLTLHFQGEPYLNPHFFDFVQFASARNIYTATSTNAHFLTEENAEKTVRSGLDRLVVSIDGVTQETYQSYRIGGKLHRVIEGTKRVAAWKKKLNTQKPLLIFQFLVVKPNEHEVPQVKELAKELSVDRVHFKTAQIYDYENGSPLIPDNDKYSRYRKIVNGKYAIKNQLDNHCWRMWHAAVVTWDGAVLPCCFDKDAQHAMGNLKDGEFKEIWNGAKYQEFRCLLMKSRKEIDICRNCTEGMAVWA